MLVSFRGTSRKPPKNPLRAAKGATGYLLGNKDHKGQERALSPFYSVVHRKPSNRSLDMEIKQENTPAGGFTLKKKDPN